MPKISPCFVTLQVRLCKKKLINSTDNREQYGLLMKGSILKMSQHGKKCHTISVRDRNREKLLLPAVMSNIG